LALLRHARRPASAWPSYAVVAAAVTGVAVEPALVALTLRHRLPEELPATWGGVLVGLLVAWGLALLMRRRRHRRGVRKVGQWVRSARIEGGQLEGLAGVRAGAPLAGELAVGWLSLERELVRFHPDPRLGMPEACWTVPWHAVSVVDVAPAALLRHRLVPGLRRSRVGLRLRASAATLVVEVDEDPRSVLRTWAWRGVGHSPRGTRTRR
jgi:hypothetical protein